MAIGYPIGSSNPRCRGRIAVACRAGRQVGGSGSSVRLFDFRVSKYPPQSKVLI
jgi:hypothetical protein